MEKVKSSFRNMVLTLFVITLIASLALGAVYNLTKEPIALAQKRAREAAIKMVIPSFDTLKTFSVKPVNGEDSLVFNEGYRGDTLVGIAILSYSREGYDPTTIKVMVGFKPEGIIDNTEVVQQKETPGLGTKIKTPKFKDQFNDKNPQNFKLKVKKDGGMVDAITAATISSRAYCDAVNRAYITYEKYMEDRK